MKKLLAWVRLARLSNAPTAIADVIMGAAVARGLWFADGTTALLAMASLCLYHGGMVLNDAVDAEVDADQDRGRPIASGLITRAAAYRCAWGLLAVGVVTASAVSYSHGSYMAAVLALLIAGCVVLYNTRFKRTLLGPLLMGTCRALNVLLGASVALTAGLVVQLAPGVLAYVAGLTLFARDEAFGGRRGQLLAGVSISVLGLLWLATAPWITPVGRWPRADAFTWALLWLVTACFVFRGAAAAILQPTPTRIGRAVGIGVQGIVVIDAALAAGYASPVAGLAVLACLPIAMLLARWIPPT